MIGPGYWMPSHRADPRGLAIYKRHYSAVKNAPYRDRYSLNFVGPGSPMVLLGRDCQALWVWLRNTTERYDHQDGIGCSVFRNEGGDASEPLIREAEQLAWAKWPMERLFTYIDPDAVASEVPGWCFLRARWRFRGLSKEGLLLLDKTEGPSCRWPRRTREGRAALLGAIHRLEAIA